MPLVPLFAFAPIGLGAAAALLLSAGVVLGLSGRFGERVGMPPAAPPASASASASERAHAGEAGYRIVALGDSITAGVGDARAGGYPARLARMLRERGRAATLVNLAVPGAETGDVLARAGTDTVRAEIARASLIVVSAGGNDLTHAVRPMPDHAEITPEEAASHARANLHALVRRLRATNPDAPIRLVGLYNPFPVLPAEEPEARAQLAAWNDLIDAAARAHRGVLAIPVGDLFYGRPDRLAADHYHPGPRGHELIARRVLDTLPEGDESPSRSTDATD